MRLVVLSDNRRLDNSVEIEHGLCIYLETANRKCLLDTGASDLFIRNAEKLGIDLSTVDYVFISHGHADHIGGLTAFLEINTTARIVLSHHTLKQGFFSKRIEKREIGISLDTSQFAERLIFIDQLTMLEDDIQVLPCCSDAYLLPKANCNLYKDLGKGLVHDDFNHELAFAFGANRLLVYTGCAHKGLLNILETVERLTEKPISVVIGGFHLLERTDNQQYESHEEIDQIAAVLKTDYPFTDFFTGHCTGDKVYSQLKKTLDRHLSPFYVGFSIDFCGSFKPKISQIRN